MCNLLNLNDLVEKLMTHGDLVSNKVLIENKYRPGQIILRTTGQKNTAFIVASGAVKVYGLNPRYREFIIDFYMKNEIVLLLDIQNELYVESIDHSKVFQVELDGLERYARDSVELCFIWCQILKTILQKKMQREHELLTMSAKERYEKLILSNKRLIQDLSQRQVASYLGITPVALTRLKRNGKTSYQVMNRD